MFPPSALDLWPASDHLACVAGIIPERGTFGAWRRNRAASAARLSGMEFHWKKRKLPHVKEPSDEAFRSRHHQRHKGRGAAQR